jgi:hypothetical protein
MMVCLLMYAYSTNEYSSRGIERHCRQDIAYRVITANQVPDHATVARFLVRHQAPLGELFTQVLELCGKAGLVRSGVVAIDGTKMRGSASRDVNVDYGQIAKEIIEAAIETDEAEDEEHGDARGDELPDELSTDEGRRAWLARELTAKRESETDSDEEDGEPEPGYEFDAEKIVARVQGRDGWLLDAKRQLDQSRWQNPAPVPRSREERLWDAGRRLEEELDAKRQANEAYERYRATAIDGLGRKLSRYRMKPYTPPDTPDGQVNLTDPDARLMMGHKMFVQGYNAQAVVTEDQIVLAAEVTTEPIDFGQLAPMISATDRELANARIPDGPQVVVADAGYWNERTMDQLAIRGVAVLIPPDSGKRKGNRTDQRPGWDGGRYSWMRQLLASDLGGELYRKRKQSIEPVFGHTKHNRKFTQFHRRGRGPVRTEWRLLMMTHNLGKLVCHER